MGCYLCNSYLKYNSVFYACLYLSRYSANKDQYTKVKRFLGAKKGKKTGKMAKNALWTSEFHPIMTFFSCLLAANTTIYSRIYHIWCKKRGEKNL